MMRMQIEILTVGALVLKQPCEMLLVLNEYLNLMIDKTYVCN